MIITLIIVSIIVFIVIQLPAGDYLSSYIADYETKGQSINQDIVEVLREQYHLDDPLYKQYLSWIKGFFIGDFGYSLDWQSPVRVLIGERLLLTIIMVLLTMVFNWIVAFTIGLYSATHKYSIGDHFATFLGFLGISIPGFALAIIIMWFAVSVFGISIGGLFSKEFVNAPWSIERIYDMIKHLYVPIIVIGLSGTAFLIRILRANLLDELSKPYVEAAKAKGVHRIKLLLKYPLRIAILPFISTAGWEIPNTISRQLIVAIVLGIPVLGPLLVTALKNQDMYLAGTILLFLSLLTIIGTFISDILLAWVDPRIRLD